MVAGTSFPITQQAGLDKPVISSFDPGSMVAGSPAFQLTLHGSYFETGASVYWNGQRRDTRPSGVTQLIAQITAADVMAEGGADVTVVNPSGRVSDPKRFTINPANNPVPSISTLSPTSMTAGAPAFRLAVTGKDFVVKSRVRWNGHDLATDYEKSTILTAVVPASDLLTAGKAALTVFNPEPGGGESAAATFEIVEGLCITDVSPSSAQQGGGDYKLTVFGENLGVAASPQGKVESASSSIEGKASVGTSPLVLWNGQPLSTAVVSPTQLSATVPATLLVSGATAYITLAGGSGASNAVPVPISLSRPTPLVSKLTPESTSPFGDGFTLTVEGTNFVSDSKVLWSGVERVTRFIDSTRLQADIPREDIQATGAASVTVSNPQPGGGESNRQTFRIVSTQLYPRLASDDGALGPEDTSEYTGIAMANLGSAEAPLTFTAFGKDGQPIAGAGVTNPAYVTIQPGEQLPVVDFQVFGNGLPAIKPMGWFKVETPADKVVGFFLMFNRTLSILDGTDVSSVTSGSWVAPEVEAEGFTQLHVANQDISPARVVFELYGQDGKLRTDAAVRELAANAAVVERLGELFPGVQAVASDYVRATSDRGVVLFEYMGKAGQFVQGLNGQDPTRGATTLYSPQYVVGGADWRTTMAIVNLDGNAGTVTFRFIGEDGTQIGSTRVRDIPARGKIYVSDQKFFVDAGSQLKQGYVEIKSDGIRLVGSLVFGDPGRSRFSSSLPLVSQLTRDMVFSQVASNETYFTGLAILNPGDAAVNAAVEVYDASGKVIAAKVERIEGKRRRSGVLTQWFPELTGQSRASGYIRVKADGAVASFALFGTQDLTALSAVPAQAVP